MVALHPPLANAEHKPSDLSCDRTIPKNPCEFYINHKLTSDSEVEANYYRLGPEVCVYCSEAITDSTIVEECDELYQKFSNVRPSCKKNGCGEHRTSHPHKNPNKKRKRPRVRQPRDAKRRKLNPYDLDLVAVTISVQSWVFVRSSERKSIVTNSKFYLNVHRPKGAKILRYHRFL